MKITAFLHDVLLRHLYTMFSWCNRIDFALLAAPNLARSEVYKMLNEEEKPTSPSYIDQRQIQQEQFNCTTIPAGESADIVFVNTSFD